MEDLFFGEGWLDDLLKEAGRPPAIKEKVRDRVQNLAGGEETGGWEEEWRSIDDLLEHRQVGTAFDRAIKSLYQVVEELKDITGPGTSAIESTFCPFLIRRKEIEKILHTAEGLDELSRPRDDLEIVMSLEMINAARRLLASWGAVVAGKEACELIPRIEGELDELRECQAFFLGDDELELLDSERELELADRLATLATSFAENLVDLHLLNAAKPEVRMRFGILWEAVRQQENKGSVKGAAFEALQVFEEALSLAGLGGGELLQRVDLLYERFGDAEGLRQAVNHLEAVSRDGEGDLENDRACDYIEAIDGALNDLGLELY